MVMGGCARRAVQRFIGLFRPARTSERSKGGNAEVDIAGIWHEQKYQCPTRRRVTGAPRGTRTKKTTLSLVGSHPHFALRPSGDAWWNY